VKAPSSHVCQFHVSYSKIISSVSPLTACSTSSDNYGMYYYIVYIIIYPCLVVQTKLLHYSKQNYYIISLSAIIKAIFTSQHIRFLNRPTCYSPLHLGPNPTQNPVYTNMHVIIFLNWATEAKLHAVIRKGARWRVRFCASVYVSRCCARISCFACACVSSRAASARDAVGTCRTGLLCACTRSNPFVPILCPLSLFFSSTTARTGTGAAAHTSAATLSSPLTARTISPTFPITLATLPLQSQEGGGEEQRGATSAWHETRVCVFVCLCVCVEVCACVCVCESAIGERVYTDNCKVCISLPHTHTLSLALHTHLTIYTNTHSHFLSLSHRLFLSHTCEHTLSLSFSLSFFLAHTHT